MRNDKEVVLHNGGSNQGLELVNLEPPQVTYDEDLNKLTVYFGSSSTIDLECDDGTGNHIISYMVNTIRVTYDAMGYLI